MSTNKSGAFYNPPLTPNGDRDWRAEVKDWKRSRSIEGREVDQSASVVIDNLLDALDAARKQRDDARSPGAWRQITNTNDRSQ